MFFFFFIDPCNTCLEFLHSYLALAIQGALFRVAVLSLCIAYVTVLWVFISFMILTCQDLLLLNFDVWNRVLFYKGMVKPNLLSPVFVRIKTSAIVMKCSRRWIHWSCSSTLKESKFCCNGDASLDQDYYIHQDR